MSSAEEVAGLVEDIDRCWLEGRFGDLQRYFQPEMVLTASDFEKRLVGCEAIVDPYRQFGESARHIDFRADEPRVDIVGDTAVSTTDFEVVYELAAGRHRDQGTGLLVFHRSDRGWQVVWRTVVLKGSEKIG